MATVTTLLNHWCLAVLAVCSACTKSLSGWQDRQNINRLVACLSEWLYGERAAWDFKVLLDRYHLGRDGRLRHRGRTWSSVFVLAGTARHLLNIRRNIIVPNQAVQVVRMNTQKFRRLRIFSIGFRNCVQNQLPLKLINRVIIFRPASCGATPVQQRLWQVLG